MPYLKIIIVSCLFISSLYAQERMSSGSGNAGGDAIVCPEKVVLLDSYEARKRHWVLDLGEASGLRSKVNFVVNKLATKDQFLSRKLYEYAMEMVDDLELLEQYPDRRSRTVYLGNDVINDIDDSFEVSLPAGCSRKQLVSQRTPRFSMEYRYQIDKSIWQRMEVTEKAMTVLHEVWYRIMLENGATNSIATRYINGLVASNNFEQLSFQDYIRDLRNTELNNYVVVNNSGAIYDGEIPINLSSESLVFGNDDLVCAQEVKFKTNLKRRTRRLDIKFPKMCFKNSTVRELVVPQRLLRKRIIRQSVNIVLNDWYVRISGSTADLTTMYFYPSGRFHRIEGANILFLQRMWYRCGDGKKTYERLRTCTGPYWDRSLRYSIESEVEFAEDEHPIGQRFHQDDEGRPLTRSRSLINTQR